MVIIDTSLLIDHLRLNVSNDSLLASLSLQYPDNQLAISSISIQELFAGQSTKKSQVTEQIAKIVSALVIFDYTPPIAKSAGMITRDYHLTFADAAIAATCVHYQAQLATLNTKDFAGIPNLELLKLA